MNSYNCEDIYKYYKKMGGTLAYNIFKKIIAENNKRNSALVINTGYEYHMPHKLFLIKVVKNKRKISLTSNNTIRGAVNWGESNKLKKRLLEEGKTLYISELDDKGRIISDNGGEKWLVYFTDEYYHILIGMPSLYLHNCNKYDFKPTWTNARALVSAITEDSDLIYKETQRYGTSRRDFIKAIDAKNRHDVWDKQQ